MLVTIPALALTTVDTAVTQNLGERFVDKNGNEYIYALGIGSTVVGSLVALSLETTNNTPITALLTETIGAKGTAIAVALASTVAATYGWYQIFGTAEVSCLISDAADAVQYCTTTPGSMDDAGTTKIHGIRLVDTEGGSATTNLTVFLTYPYTAA